MEEDLKIENLEMFCLLDRPQSGITFWIVTHPSTTRPIALICEIFLMNHSSDLPQILNLGLGNPTKIEDSWIEDNLNWKTTSKY